MKNLLSVRRQLQVGGVLGNPPILMLLPKQLASSVRTVCALRVRSYGTAAMASNTNSIFSASATAQIINSIIRVDDPKDQEALLDIIGDFFCNRGDHSNHLHEGR